MAKLTKEKRDQLIVVCLVTVLVVFCLWYLVINTQQSTLVENRKRVEELVKKSTAAKELARKREKYRMELDQAQTRLDAIEATMLPVGNEYVTLFETIKDRVRSSKVEFLGDLTQPTIGDTDLLPRFQYKSASFEATFYGYYHDLGKFLAGLENDYPYMRFQLMSLRHPDVLNPEKPEQLRLELKIVALVKPTTAK
jgi:Tfp pilus assembly protein PilO